MGDGGAAHSEGKDGDMVRRVVMGQGLKEKVKLKCKDEGSKR